MNDILHHGGLFLLSLSVIWLLSGKLIDVTERVALRYNKPGFAVAFFVLGFFTSISEISVAVNATIEGVPEIAAGNLVGASIVIFLLIIPLLAIVGKRIDLDHAISRRNLGLTLFIVTVPALCAMDGTVGRREGVMLLLLYATLIYRLRKRNTLEETIEETVEDVRKELLRTRRTTALDLLHIAGAAFLIFVAGNVLVDESVFFTDLIGVPHSIAGLLILSIGTNIPELMIAIRSALSGRMDIAFGDYLGSAVANVPLLGLVTLAHGTFSLHAGEFIISFGTLAIGLSLFFLFARSKNDINRREGSILLLCYLLFLVLQITGTALRA